MQVGKIYAAQASFWKFRKLISTLPIHLSLSFDKIGCGSGKFLEISQAHFHTSRLPFTIFAA